MILTLAHQKGGTGKSTVSWNLATLLSKKHKLTVIDLDVQKTITQINKIRTSNEKYKPLKIVNIDSEDELKEYIANDSEDKLTLIDTGGFDSSINRIAVYLSDIVICPVSDTFSELTGLIYFKEEILDEIETLSGDKINVYVLLNNISPNTKNFDTIENFIDGHSQFTLMDSKIRRLADYDRCCWLGEGVNEFASESKAAKDFKKFSKEIRKIIKKVEDGED